jgi:hypothetical protein
MPTGDGTKCSGGEGGWLPAPDDQKRLKPSCFSIFIEHPIITLVVALLIGVAVFGDLFN